jgi:hypothetical protein
MSGQHYGYYGPPPGYEGRERWPEERDVPNVGKRVRNFLIALSLAFSVTLAIILGQRLSDQAVSILAGAACGVAASIPTSLLIVWVTRQRSKEEKVQRQQPAQGMYPPVIVVQPPAQPGLPPGQQQAYPQMQPPAPRQFTVVGEEFDAGDYGRRR